jgi:hypothetical protein
VIDSVARLRRLVERLPELGDDGCWLATRMGDYLAADGADLEERLGLRPGPGEDHWRTIERRAERDRLIRRLASGYPDLAALAAELRRYECVCWPRERRQGEPPTKDERRRLMWRIFACGLRVPTSVRWLRQIVEQPGSETDLFTSAAAE